MVMGSCRMKGMASLKRVESMNSSVMNFSVISNFSSNTGKAPSHRLSYKEFVLLKASSWCVELLSCELRGIVSNCCGLY